jgi:outer membrane protein
MKKFILFLFVAAGLMMTSTVAMAQKIGYISSEDVIPFMPEAKKADSALKEYEAFLNLQGDEYAKEYYRLDSIFAADSAKWSPAVKQVKKDALIKAFTTVQQWNQTAQQMYQQEQQKQIAPLQKKAYDAIQAVAKEAAYTYVLDKSVIIVAPPGDDLSPLVKKKLGIKETAAPAGGIAPKKN